MNSIHHPPLQVSLNMDDGRSLGLMIRGGAEYGLGIYITGVDPGSAADVGALKVRRLNQSRQHSTITPPNLSNVSGLSRIVISEVAPKDRYLTRPFSTNDSWCHSRRYWLHYYMRTVHSYIMGLIL